MCFVTWRSAISSGVENEKGWQVYMYKEAAGIMGNYQKSHAKCRHAGFAGPLGPTPSLLLVSLPSAGKAWDPSKTGQLRCKICVKNAKSSRGWWRVRLSGKRGVVYRSQFWPPWRLCWISTKSASISFKSYISFYIRLIIEYTGLR